VSVLALALAPSKRAEHLRMSTRSQSGVLRGINLNPVNLQVTNLDRSEAFYRRLFSLPPKREV
jgi:hypothetical protein